MALPDALVGLCGDWRRRRGGGRNEDEEESQLLVQSSSDHSQVSLDEIIYPMTFSTEYCNQWSPAAEYIHTKHYHQDF